MTREQLDNWFTYHPPTEDVAPKYAVIRKAEQEVHSLLGEFRLRAHHRNTGQSAQGFDAADCDRVNAVTRAFAETIDAHAPESADKSAAIRCVRLARNAANEWVMANASPGFPLYVDNLVIAQEEAVKARWQANGAIACGGK